MPPLIRQQLPRPIVPREECETDNHNQSHAQVARKTFSLKPVVVDCHPSTTLEDFASALLLQPQQPPLNTPGRSASPFARTDYFALSSRSHSNHRASVPLSPWPLSLLLRSPILSSPRISIAPRESSRSRPSNYYAQDASSPARRCKPRRSNSSSYPS